MPDMGETTKLALVTGASRGFGAAVAEVLAADGWHVIALARTVGALEELDDRIKAAGGQTTLVPLDITDEGGLQRLCLSIFERWGRLDLLVHCAFHAMPLSPVSHMGEQDWDKSLAINIRATQRIIALSESLLQASKSGTAIFPEDQLSGKFLAAYSTTKAAQKALVDAWSAETAKTGPRVLGFTPDPMPTALRGRFFPGEDKDVLADPKEQARKLLKLL